MKRQRQIHRTVVTKRGRPPTLGPSLPLHPAVSLEHEQALAPSENGKEEYHARDGICPGLDLSAG